MPDGGLSLIRQRFADEIDDGEKESDPYVTPPSTTHPESESSEESQSNPLPPQSPSRWSRCRRKTRGPIVERDLLAQAGGIYIPLTTDSSKFHRAFQQ